MSPLESPGCGISHISASCPSWCHISDSSHCKTQTPGCFSLPGLCDGPFSLNQQDGQAGYTRNWKLTGKLSLYPALICWHQNTTSFWRGWIHWSLSIPCSLTQQHCWQLPHKFRCHLLPLLGDEPCHQFARFLLSVGRVFQAVYSHLWHVFFFLGLRKLSFMLKFPHCHL